MATSQQAPSPSEQFEFAGRALSATCATAIDLREAIFRIFASLSQNQQFDLDVTADNDGFDWSS